MSKAKELINLINENDILKSLRMEVWDYDSVNDFVKAKQEDISKYQRLADDVFYHHNREAKEIVDLISDEKKLADFYNKVRENR